MCVGSSVLSRPLLGSLVVWQVKSKIMNADRQQGFLLLGVKLKINVQNSQVEACHSLATISTG